MFEILEDSLSGKLTRIDIVRECLVSETVALGISYLSKHALSHTGSLTQKL